MQLTIKKVKMKQKTYTLSNGTTISYTTFEMVHSKRIDTNFFSIFKWDDGITSLEIDPTEHILDGFYKDQLLGIIEIMENFDTIYGK